MENVGCLTLCKRERIRFWFVSALFFLSGATGLTYEVIWFKRFSHVWGSSTLAMAAVVASFLGGLGLGAYWLGKFADRLRYPLVAYGICELLIGGLAVVIPFELLWLQDLWWLSVPLRDYPACYFLLRLFLTVAIIGLPCFLMGGTLPFLVRQLTPPTATLSHATGWLYAVNTFGAAVGCYFAGFHLLPVWGFYGTNVMAAVLNLVIGVVSLLLVRFLPRASDSVSVSAEPVVCRVHDPLEATWRDGPTIRVVYTAALLTGLAALVLQMIWTRQLSLILGGTTYAFTATLSVFLAAIALGSLLYHFWVRGFATHADVPLLVISLIVFFCVSREEHGSRDVGFRGFCP